MCVCKCRLTDSGLATDRDHEGHRRRRAHTRGGCVLRRELLLRDGGAHSVHRRRVSGRDLDAHERDQLLHAPDQDDRPGHRPAAVPDAVHRAGVRGVHRRRQGPRVRAPASSGAAVAERRAVGRPAGEALPAARERACGEGARVRRECARAARRHADALAVQTPEAAGHDAGPPRPHSKVSALEFMFASSCSVCS